MNADQREMIRNFSIIAHIDHGKSTLAEKLIKIAIPKKTNYKAFDNLDVEKRKGITIKLNPVRLEYKNSENKNYTFNLIDTPGHADFSYEVSRSLASCEGVLLLVDSTKGVQAQTVAYLNIAKKLNLKIIPVVNKIDLASALVKETQENLKKILNFKDKEFCFISSKTGLNVEKLLAEIIESIPSPLSRKIKNGEDTNQKKVKEEFLRALVFDLFYDKYKGVIIYIRVFDGIIKSKQKIKFFHSKKTFQVEKIGVKVPENFEKNKLEEGEIGWFCANIRNMEDVQVGETVFDIRNENANPLEGYQKIKPNLYSNIYPEETNKYKEIRKAIDELKLQDGSFQVKKMESNLLGSGFRCGFLGVLHKDVIEERIRKEYKIDLITTPPTVSYEILKTDGQKIEISNPQNFPDPSKIKFILELSITIKITVPEKYMGEVNKICQEKRGIYKKSEIYGDKLWIIEYEMPFSEFVYDFNDRLKSISQGYASFDYDFVGFKNSKIVKIDILINKEKIEDLSFLVHQSSAYERSKKICEELKFTLNPQSFEISIQACVGKKVLAKESIKPFRKDVISKCYGGDVTRKKKLLEKQKKGKKRMKESGRVSFSKDSFRNILKRKEN